MFVHVLFSFNILSVLWILGPTPKAGQVRTKDHVDSSTEHELYPIKSKKSKIKSVRLSPVFPTNDKLEYLY